MVQESQSDREKNDSLLASFFGPKENIKLLKKNAQRAGRVQIGMNIENRFFEEKVLSSRRKSTKISLDDLPIIKIRITGGGLAFYWPKGG